MPSMVSTPHGFTVFTVNTVFCERLSILLKFRVQLLRPAGIRCWRLKHFFYNGNLFPYNMLIVQSIIKFGFYKPWLVVTYKTCNFYIDCFQLITFYTIQFSFHLGQK